MARILVVEDDETEREWLSQRLGRQGYYVETAMTGAEGVQKATMNPPDLILFNIGFPEIDGYEAAMRLKGGDLTRFIPIIALTAQLIKGDGDSFVKNGFDDYDTKPVEMERLLTKINNFIG